MILGCMVWELPGMDIIGHIRWVREHGFEAVDFHANPSLAGKGIDLNALTDESTAELIDALTGFEAVGIHAAFSLDLETPIDATREGSLRYLERTCQLGALVGAKTVTVHRRGAPVVSLHEPLQDAHADALVEFARGIGAKSVTIRKGAAFEATPEQMRDIFADSLVKLREMGERHGVVLCLEIEEDYEMVLGLNSPHVRICTDLGHICFNDGAGYREHGSIAGLIRYLDDGLGHVHVHDWDGANDHLPVGDGGHDWPQIMEALRDIGYGGALVLEINPAAHGAEGILKSRDRLVELM